MDVQPSVSADAKLATAPPAARGLIAKNARKRGLASRAASGGEQSRSPPASPQETKDNSPKMETRGLERQSRAQEDRGPTSSRETAGQDNEATRNRKGEE
ncbi:Hypothetical predicted protein [Pelobates cultripes]|uniref:Uncharacterized protein n=1 Tax=Pelobates cultripes TaxID=61616 RepID=A0AAD1RMB2_PELCU|nr:Hypothetical predicted protein [Pelobates cultripes]